MSIFYFDSLILGLILFVAERFQSVTLRSIGWPQQHMAWAMQAHFMTATKQVKQHRRTGSLHSTVRISFLYAGCRDRVKAPQIPWHRIHLSHPFKPLSISILLSFKQ